MPLFITLLATMSTTTTIEEPLSMSQELHSETYRGPPRNIAYIDQLNFDPSLQPVHQEIQGTPLNSSILILDIRILEATGRPPYHGDILINGTYALIYFGASVSD